MSITTTESARNRAATILFDLAPSGHRAGYLDYVSSLLAPGTARVIFGRSLANWLLLILAPRILMSSADHYPVFAASVGLIRRMVGKSSPAIYIASERLRPGRGCFATLKYGLLRLARVAKLLRGCAITPFELDPFLKRLCCEWVYDLQFCAPNRGSGATLQRSDGEARFLCRVEAQKAAGRRVVLLLGNVIGSRGLDEFLDTARGIGSDAGWTFVLAGASTYEPARFDLPERTLLTHLKRIDEETFDRLIELADLIWCYFPPSYNQNSGLFCNAIRASKPVLVRSGGFLERLGTRHFGLQRGDCCGTAYPPDGVVLCPDASTAQKLKAAARESEMRIHHLLDVA